MYGVYGTSGHIHIYLYQCHLFPPSSLLPPTIDVREGGSTGNDNYIL